MAGKVTTGQHV